MHVLPRYKRIALLTEGCLGVFTSKTAAALLRYRAADVCGVVDSIYAGQDVRDRIPWSQSHPVVAAIGDLPPPKPEALFIGIAPVGGDLPAAMRRHLLDALQRGIDVVSGLHTRLADDAELADAAKASGARLLDLRRPPARQTIATAAARGTRCRRVLTVGTDCNVGKMVAALELTAAARRHGLDARFAATGQTGIMICGRGVAVDAVVADFCAGAAEELVLDAAGADVCFIEGQGSLAHPGYSGVTLALLHGACPDALVLVHHAGRECFSAEPHHPLPSLAALRDAYEAAAGWLHPARVVGVALNTVGLSDAAAADAVREIEGCLGLPVADVVRSGCERLLAAALAPAPPQEAGTQRH